MVLFVINDEDNSAVDGGGWRRRVSRFSALLYSKAEGVLRASSSTHEDDTNDRDKDKYTAW